MERSRAIEERQGRRVTGPRAPASALWLKISLNIIEPDKKRSLTLLEPKYSLKCDEILLLLRLAEGRFSLSQQIPAHKRQV